MTEPILIALALGSLLWALCNRWRNHKRELVRWQLKARLLRERETAWMGRNKVDISRQQWESADRRGVEL